MSSTLRLINRRHNLLKRQAAATIARTLKDLMRKHEMIGDHFLITPLLNINQEEAETILHLLD